MEGSPVVTVLHAAVRVTEHDKTTGETLLRPIGFNNDGVAIMRPATRIVLVEQGQPLPKNIADGELSRLQGLGVVAVQAQTSAPTAAPAEAAREADQAMLDRFDELTDTELVEFLETSQVGVRKLRETVGDDAARAARLVAAEKQARKGDARSSLIEPLERLVEKAGETP